MILLSENASFSLPIQGEQTRARAITITAAMNKGRRRFITFKSFFSLFFFFFFSFTG